MFNLFKIRDFGELFNDTFLFFKVYGKNYFKNYLKLTAISLVAIVVLIYFLSKFFISGIINSSDSDYMASYFDENLGLIITASVLAFIFLIFFSIFNFAYPIAYFKNIEDSNHERNIDRKQTLKILKQNSKRILIFVLGTTFILLPVFFIAVFISSLLMMIIIGIFGFMLIIPYFMALLNISFFEFIVKKNDFFSSVQVAVNVIHSNFWKVIGSTLCLLMIIQIISGIFIMIPYMFGMFFLISNPNGIEENASSLGIGIAILYALNLILSLVLNNLVVVNHGLTYYSYREFNENHTAKNQIDLIGKNED